MAKQAEETPKKTVEQQVKKTKTRKGWKIAKTVLLGTVVIGAITFGAINFKLYNDLKKNPVSSQEAQQQENQRIIAAVGKLYTLPEGEEPVIFFVSDKDKLSEDYKKQEFFQKAVNGDYILIYEKAKLAILYRPSQDKIIDARPYTVQNSLAIALIGVEADRVSVEKTLKDTFKTELTIQTKNDGKASYTGVTVVDLTGKYAEQAKKIADSLKGKVGTLPEGETKPEGVDIVVIAGSSQPAAAPAQ